MRELSWVLGDWAKADHKEGRRTYSHLDHDEDALVVRQGDDTGR